MIIKIEGLDMAYDGTQEEAAKQVAAQFDVIVELEGRTGGGGWPTVSLIGTPGAILKALTSEGGWSTGGYEDDAEMAFEYLRTAKVLFG